MTEIRAFIGHSFLTKDSDLVRTFLDYFDELQLSLGSFMWSSARSAETKPIEQKVLDGISDKNLFIGICTAHEAAVSIDRKGLFGFFFLGSKQLTFKASDWIIQEIGLAVGRDLKLLILKEKGVRVPGGLQGTIEYIEFERNAPEKSFPKILQTLRALQPKIGTPTPVATNDKVLDKTKTDEAEDAPSTDWTLEQFESALFYAQALSNDDQIAKLKQAFDGSAHCSPVDLARWDALYEHNKAVFGHGADLTKLKRLAEDNPDNPEIAYYLAHALGTYGEHESAIQVYEASASKVTEPKEKVTLLGRAAIVSGRAGQMPRALQFIESAKAICLDDEALQLLLATAIETLANEQKDTDTRLIAQERILELQPDNNGVRFDIGYEYSQHYGNALALYHYVRIPVANRNGYAWNNLGAAYAELSMQAKAVDAYRQSKITGNSLAMANLGYKYAAEGFLDEAYREYEEASQQSTVHKNVGSLLARIQEIPGKEDELLNKTLKEVQPRHNFFKELGRALMRKTPKLLATDWQGSEGRFQVTLDDTTFIAECFYEQDAYSGLLKAFSGLLGPEKEKYCLRISGSFSGHVFKGVMTRNKATELTPVKTLLDIGVIKLFGIMSNSYDHIWFMQGSNLANDAKFFEINTIRQLTVS